ncbi:MAG: hypothetical protein ACOZIN_08990 [Myxococcota bacterium]
MLALLPLVLAAAPAMEIRATPQGPLTFAAGALSAPLTGELTEAARAFALSRRSQLGLPLTSTLGPAHALGTRFGGSLRFAQLVEGVPVQDAEVVVTVDTARRVVLLSSSAVPYRRSVSAWKVSSEEALRLAAREVEGATLRPDGLPYGGTARRYFRVGEEVHAGYLVRLVHVRPDENWYAGVDATTGTVLFTQNRVHHADTAQVYAPSPGGLSGGVGVTPTVEVTLQHLVPTRAGGFLEGDQLTVYNCCPSEGCVAGAPAKRVTGTFQGFQGDIPYDVAICDRRQRATNDPQVHASGDYVYSPVDPPTSGQVSSSEPADSDEFAEVHAYHHINYVYDFLRSLSTQGPTTLPAFQMRDEKKGKKPAVWTNATMPDFYSAQQNAQGVLVGNNLYRTDNAAFLPVEGMDSMVVPEYALDVDTLLIYQGDKADFAYDGPVLWHEFGHGAIYATANFSWGVTVDSRSALGVGGALHEGIADILAAFLGQDPKVGAYVGPRTGTGNSIRDIEEDLVCPDSLWGESHQDGRFFSGAVWDARKDFLGSDQGRTFDAAFYAALVSQAPNATFDSLGAALITQVEAAFPSVADAREKLEALFTARGVLGCSKIVDVTNDRAPRQYYYVPGSMEAGVTQGSLVPGPYQMKLSVPTGAKSLTLTGPYQTFGTGTVRVTVMAKKDNPITFTRSGSGLTHDADVTLVPTVSQGRMSATVPIEVPCGGELYFTVAGNSGRGRALTELGFSYEEADACPAPVPPQEPTPPEPIAVSALSEDAVAQGPVPPGCGCGTGGGAALGLLALLGALRRRRSARGV